MKKGILFHPIVPLFWHCKSAAECDRLGLKKRHKGQQVPCVFCKDSGWRYEGEKVDERGT